MKYNLVGNLQELGIKFEFFLLMCLTISLLDLKKTLYRNKVEVLCNLLYINKKLFISIYGILFHSF